MKVGKGFKKLTTDEHRYTPSGHEINDGDITNTDKYNGRFSLPLIRGIEGVACHPEPVEEQRVRFPPFIGTQARSVPPYQGGSFFAARERRLCRYVHLLL